MTVKPAYLLRTMTDKTRGVNQNTREDFGERTARTMIGWYVREGRLRQRAMWRARREI